MGFDEAWAHQVVGQLRTTGVEFDAGLDDAAIREISAVFAAEVPLELKLFLQAGVPTSPKWAAWGEGPQVVLERAQAWILRAFSFDIEHNRYWHPLLGERPGSVGAAVDQACAHLLEAPPLIPVYAHRFLATQPTDGPRAVLSVWQAVDSIYYGNDLADYLAREFTVDRPSWATADPPPVPVWEELLGLN
jgi:hypothetical protein